MEGLIRHPLVYIRLARGWSQEDLARRIRHAARLRGFRSGIDRKRVSKWETGYATPNDESQLFIGDVLGVDASVVASLDWPEWLPGLEIPMPLGWGSTVPALREALRTSMDRRAFLTYSSSALVGLAAQWAAADGAAALERALNGGSVGTDFIDVLEETGRKLSGMITSQRQYTPQLLDAHLATVTEMLGGDWPRDVRRRLHVLAGELGQTVGWYRFDHGLHASASRLWQAALHSAHAAGDRDLGAALLSDLAYQATWLASPKTAVQILEHAVSGAAHPSARSLLYLRLGRAHAALGEGRSCRKALELSEKELCRAEGLKAPPWCGWLSGADLLVDSGQCLLDLGERERAHELIDGGVSLLPAARAKTRAIFQVYEAGSFLQAGEVEAAAACAREALTLSREIGAPRCLALVRELLPAFEATRGAEGVEELFEIERVAGAPSRSSRQGAG
ncbi:helix-turn-helix transcriptional regulator [Streptomyces noursei]